MINISINMFMASFLKDSLGVSLPRGWSDGRRPDGQARRMTSFLWSMTSMDGIADDDFLEHDKEGRGGYF